MIRKPTRVHTRLRTWQKARWHHSSKLLLKTGQQQEMDERFKAWK
jgi:hypothetical protein